MRFLRKYFTRLDQIEGHGGVPNAEESNKMSNTQDEIQDLTRSYQNQIENASEAIASTGEVVCLMF